MKNKVFIILVFVLLLSNIIVLCFYINKCKKGSRGNMIERISNDIGFNATQKETFIKQKEALSDKTRVLKDSLIQLKNELVLLQMQQPNDSAIQHYVNKMSTIMLGIERLNFASIEESKKICTQQQIPIYDSIIKKMMLRKPYKQKK